MRIFIAVRHSIDPSYFYGGLWSGNFYPALKKLGHEIIESQTDLLPSSKFMQIADDFTSQELEVRSQITQKIIDEVKQAHRQSPIDLFLSYFYNSHFDPAGFEEIHQLGIPTVNFYCNSIYQFDLVSEIAAKVNFSWHAEKLAKESYLKVGANPVWVQMGADPDVYHPIESISRQPKACFVGQRYADRDRLLAELINAKLPLAIYGPGWGKDNTSSTNKSFQDMETGDYLARKQVIPSSRNAYLSVISKNILKEGLFGGVIRTFQQIEYRRKTKQLSPIFQQFALGAIPFQQICSVFAEYEVILSFSNVWADGRPGSKLIPHVRLRDFEAPMCRTCYLTGHTDEIAEFYDLGKEIDTYSSSEELVEKTRFYLNHPDEAEKLRNAGYQRALRDHTWECRFEQLFKEIGI